MSTSAIATAHEAEHPTRGPTCPKCGGAMWDNRATKRNPKAPDYKCRDRSCDGVIWPPKPGKDEKAEGVTKSLSAETEEIPF